MSEVSTDKKLKGKDLIIIGAFIARGLFKKHFVKAGIV